MANFLIAHEIPIRGGFFLGIFVLMAVWEIAAPRRALTTSKASRWANNLGLVVLNTVMLRLLFPAAAVGMATFATRHGWGLLQYVEVPPWLAIIMAVTALDLVIWIQHMMVHAVPGLWRIHRVHHADLDYDVTTGARFHPLEIILSMLIKCATIAVIGPPVGAVMLFEIVLNATSMFNHGNVRLPNAIDQLMRWIIVTPDMHRVHHSVEFDEMNSNFGFNLPWWDHLFGTYRATPRAGHLGMVIGIPDYRSPREVSTLLGMLWLPFLGNRHRRKVDLRQPSVAEASK